MLDLKKCQFGFGIRSKFLIFEMVLNTVRSLCYENVFPLMFITSKYCADVKTIKESPHPTVPNFSHNLIINVKLSKQSHLINF